MSVFHYDSTLNTTLEVAKNLAISGQQVRALLQIGDLGGIRVGGREPWRIEDARLKEYIKHMYREQHGGEHD